jgi:hypothetical protein
MHGREVIFFLSSATLSKLPHSFQTLANQDGVVIKLFAVLFTQVFFFFFNIIIYS